MGAENHTMPPKKKYNYTKKPGPPTKYRPEYCQELIDYFSIPAYKIDKKTFTTKNAVIEEPFAVVNDLPFLSNFAWDRKVEPATIDKWAKRYPDFQLALSHAKDLQKQFLIQNGIAGRYNSNFAVFTATNITDMRLAKQEVEASGSVSVKIVKFSGEKKG